MRDKTPQNKWEPSPPLGTLNLSGTGSGAGTYSAITMVRFSPVKPTVFAAGSADGFLYLYDLSTSATVPVATLETKPSIVSAQIDNSSTSTANDSISVSNKSEFYGGMDPHHSTSNTIPMFDQRSSVTGIAFNCKQRDFIAACDYLGRVHIWRLTWNLSHKSINEQSLLDEMEKRVT